MNSRWIALAVVALSLQAQAATVCRLVSGDTLAFGSYDVLAAAPNDTLVNVAVTCERDGGPGTVTLTVALGQGMNGSSVSARRMARAGGGDWLSYGLYREVSRTTVWGFSAGVDTVSQTLSVANKQTAGTTFTIYGRIPPGQDATVGSYSDVVQITVTP